MTKLDLLIIPQAMPMMYKSSLNRDKNRYEKDYIMSPTLRLHRFIEAMTSKTLCMVLGSEFSLDLYVLEKWEVFPAALGYSKNVSFI